MGTPLHDMIIRGMRETFLASPATSPPLLVHTDPYSLESNRQHGVAAPWAVLHIVQTSSTASTSSPTPRLPASSSSAISTTPPSHILCLPNPELLVLLSCTTLSGPPENAMLSRYVLVDSLMKEICASLMQYCRYSCIVPHFGTCSPTSAG